MQKALQQCEDKDIKVGNITEKDALIGNLNANSIPVSILESNFNDYKTFLNERRKLMASKLKDYYHSI